MAKPDDIPQDVWDKAEVIAKEATRDAMRDPLMPYYVTVSPHIARAIITAKAEEREAIQDMLDRAAPHSPRRYIYDPTADRRIWACDQLDSAIRQRGEA